MTGALVTTWRGTFPGREAQGLEVFGRALSYYDELAKEGRIHGHAEYFNPGGNPSGMLIANGEIEELQRIQNEDTFQQITGDAALVACEFTMQLMSGGSEQAVQEGVGKYLDSLQRMGFV